MLGMDGRKCDWRCPMVEVETTVQLDDLALSFDVIAPRPAQGARAKRKRKELYIVN